MDKKETLDDIIKESGMLKEAIAKRMGITSNYLWRLRKHPEKMDVMQINAFAEAVGVPVDRVLAAANRE